MVVVHEDEVKRDEPPPHGAIGMSTAYRISDAAPGPLAMEFRKRILHLGAVVGLKPLGLEPLSIIVSYPNPVA